MAYKFQLGKAKLSGSIETAGQIKVDAGGLQVAGDVALDAGVINTSELADSLVTVAKLATDAVETAKIKDLAVTNDKLAGSIASTKIAELNAFDTADLAEGTNLYYTDARARAAVSVTDVSGDGSLSYNSSTGVITYTGPSASEVRAHLSAGDGLSFAGGQFAVTSSIAGAGLAWSAGVLSVDTAEIASGLSGSVRAAVADFVEGSDFVTFDDSTGTIGVDAARFSGSADAAFDARLATKDTDDLAEGSNLYWTVARGESMFDTRLATKDTDDLAEGSTNLYYKDSRARAAISVTDNGGDGALSYNSSTGVITYTGPSPTEVRAHLSAGDFVTYASGSGLISVNAASFTGSARSVVSAGPSGGLAYNPANGRFALDAYAAGDGLSLVATGSLRVNVDASSIEINSDNLRVKALGITNSMLSGGIENGKLVNSSVTVTAGSALTGGGLVSLGGTVTLDVAVNSDALEITADAVALKSTIAGSRTFSDNVTIGGNLTVNGTTTYLNTNELIVKDSLVTIASGSSVFAANHGIELGTYASLKTAVDADVGNALSSSLPMVMPSIKAGSFYGSFVGSTVLSIESKGANATISSNVTKATANITLTLPSSPVVGQEHRVKCVVAEASSPSVIVAAQAGATIEGEASVLLQSYGAAVSLVWDGSAWMVF
jgi:hypothetical protein